MSLFQINPGLIFWTIVNFVLLALVLGRFAWKPLQRMIAEREQKIRSALDAAEKASDQAAEASKQAEAAINAARGQAASILECGRREAESSAGQILAGSRREAERIISEAKAAIEREREKAAGELRTATAEIALEVARSVLAAEMDEQKSRRLVEKFVSEVDFSELKKRLYS